MKVQQKTSRIIGSFLFLISGCLIYSAQKLPSINPYGMANAAFWPSLVLVILMILSLILVASSIRRGKTLVVKGVEEGREEINRKRLFMAMAMLLLWPLGMVTLGFILSTFLFFGTLAYILGERSKVTLLLAPLSMTVLIYLVFIQFLFISFPRGIGLFRELSLLLY